MPDPLSVIDGMLNWYRSLPVSVEVRRFVVFGIISIPIYFCVIFSIEYAYKVRTSYRSRAFAHDLAYWVWGATPVYRRLVLFGAITAAIEAPLSYIELPFVAELPLSVKIVVSTIAGDFIGYWVHRAEHRFRFLWAFHTTHHSQENLNFATATRIHPVGSLLHSLMGYIPMRLLGLNYSSSLALVVIFNMLLSLTSYINHSRIPWAYGPFYKVFVSPVFHSYHHSTDPAHHDKNFGVQFSCWDYFFNTAVNTTDVRPTRYGLDNVRPTSLWSTLVAPFYLLREFYSAPANVNRGKY